MKGKYAIVNGQVVDFNKLVDVYDLGIDDLKSRLKSIIESTCEKYEGRLLDHFSDTSKTVFKNPVNALKFVVDIHKKLALTPRIPYRSSINYGEISFDSDGIYGDTAVEVNELIEICTEGASLLTEKMHNELKDNTSVKLNLVGSSLLKSKNEAQEIYCIAEDGFYVPTQMELSDKSKNKNSIAVLPFHNTSSDKELDYICDGLAEEVIDSLTKVPDIFITARSSSFTFKNQDVSILEISRKLNVNYIIDGSIRRRNQDYRISYQLVDALTGYNIVSDSILSDFDNLYNSETIIVRKILEYFNKDTEENQVADEYYIDPNAYSYYLKGKHILAQWTPDSGEKAIQYFNRALDLVDDYALAYAGLSMCYMHYSISGRDFAESMKKSLYYAEKSIEADTTIPDGYIAKAISVFWAGKWYVPDFEKNITTALAISPCNAEIRMFNGMLFLFKGDKRRALSELKLARQLDPQSYGIKLRLGIVEYLNKEYQDAYNTFLTFPETPNIFTYKRIRLAWCAIMLHQYNKAIELLDETVDNYEFYNMINGSYLAAYHGLKDEANFFKYKEIIENQPKDDNSYLFNMSLLYRLLNNKEQAILHLEKTMQNPLFLFMFPQYDEFWELYHDEPLFKELIVSKYNSKDNKLVKIQSDTKESIEIRITDLLYVEAQDNYTDIVFKDKNKVKNKILRATLSHIEKQLEGNNIFRCHRSYIINSETDFEIKKADHKMYLTHPNLDISIPVSRSKEKEIKELFKSGF